MRRRELLKYACVSTLVSATGCVHTGGGENGSGEDDDGNGDGTTAVTGTSFSVVSREGGGSEGFASYIFENGELRVNGTIIGSDACKTAELNGAEYDSERGAIVVDIGTVTPEDAGRRMCAQILTPIKYEATIEFEGDEPSAIVRHDGEEVATDGGDNSEETSLAGTEFEVTETGCGTEANEVEYIREQAMSEGDTGSRGTVQGTLWGPDSCTTAELGYVSYDGENDALVADVRSVSTDGEACADCITEVDYRLVAEFENGVADSAEVSHDGVRVEGLGEGVEGADFSVEGREDASGDEERAEPDFDEDGGRIVVEGVVIGSDGCKTARLREATVRESSLAVDVETVDDGGGACTESLVAIRYTTTFTFEDDIPNEVSVSHDGEGVASGAYRSTSASADSSESSEEDG